VIELYLSEACPFCGKVRAYMEQKSLPYVMKPALSSDPNSRHMVELREHGGKAQVPFLFDPDKDVQMYESDDIIAYIQDNIA